jgi:hypothetical protein
VGLPDAGNFDDTVTCTAAASTTLQLYLPGLMSAIETPFKVSACPSFSVTALKAGE